MVWGGISHRVKSLVVEASKLTAARYRDEILQPTTVTLMQQNNLTFLQDNAWPQCSKDLLPFSH